MSLKKPFNFTSNQFYNVNQFRMKVWSLLKIETHGLAMAKNEEPALKDSIELNMKSLKTVEQYYAFPGIDAVNSLISLVKHHEYLLLSKAVADISRLLVSEDYRHKPSAAHHLGFFNQQKDENSDPKKSHKKYFEVLFTDKLPAKEEQEMKEKLADIREDKEGFVYNTIFAKSFQDTLIALLFNPNIQACVIRYGVLFKSNNINNVIKPFIAQVLNYKYDENSGRTISVLLGEAIRKLRPELDLYWTCTMLPIHR